MNNLPLITILTLVPLLGAVLVAGIEPRRKNLVCGLSFGFCALSLLMALALWQGFNPADGAIQFVERHAWIPSLGAEYFVGVDGLGLLLVLLTAVVVPMALLASRHIEDRVPLFHALVLFLQAGLFGTFTALNFFHWFLYWELALIPAFFLIKLWGGPGRTPAALQFFLFTMVGSVAMLLAFVGLQIATGTFDFIRLAELARTGELKSLISAKLAWGGMDGGQIALLLFAGVLLGFAVKVPLMPFHTWLPTAYAEAPSGVTMLLTGLMSKMGVYGLLRILLPIFPEQMRLALTPLLWLAVATIVLSAFAAFAQRDLKRMLAYSSVNHLGYCLLGVFAVAGAGPAVEKAAVLNGVALQVFSHGLTAAALFACVGFLEERAGGRRGIDDFGGLRAAAPVLCGLMGISLFASLGMPGLSGFVGEFLVFKGLFALAPWPAALSVLGLLATAVFLLTLMQRVFHGPIDGRWAAFADLTVAERVTLAPAVALMFVLGLWPRLATDIVNETVNRLVAALGT